MLLITPTTTVTNGVCPLVTVTQTWDIVDGCGDSTNCSQVVTVTGCCSNSSNCCGLDSGAKLISWLQLPTNGYLLPNPSGSNASGTWIITNLPCYGRVLLIQDAVPNVKSSSTRATSTARTPFRNLTMFPTPTARLTTRKITTDDIRGA